MGQRGKGAKPVNATYAARHEWKPESTELVPQIIEFIERLPVTSGMLAGTTFRVRDWQREIIEGIYGNNRKVRQAVISTPRKQGKTALTAALALCHLAGPLAEPRGQIVSAAAERLQAAILFDEMKAIIEEVADLKNRIVIREFTKSLEDVLTKSTYKALSAEVKSKHGFNLSCWIYDELAQAPDRKLFDVLATSTSARKHPVGIVISTQSADPNHIMSELVDDGERVNDGVTKDPTFFAKIYTAPMDADPWDEQTWAACNPALGDFRSLEEMQVFARQAKRIPAREATFRLLYLNQRVADEARWIDRADWDAACNKEFSLEMLEGRECYGGMDLSDKNDLSSLVLVFPLDNGDIYVMPFLWTPKKGLEEAEKRDRVPYRLWAKQGHLQTTPGQIVDYAYLAGKVRELQTRYQIKAIAFDPWKIKRWILEAEKLNLDLLMEEHGQSYRDMDGSIQALEDYVLSRRLVHNGNPALSWCIDNVMVTRDSSGNRKFDKRRTTGRIDGAVALAMAVGLAGVQEDNQFVSSAVFL